MLGVGGQAPSVICVMQQRGVMVKFAKDQGDAAHTRPLRIGELVHLTDVNVEEDHITVFLRTLEPETWSTVKALLQGAMTLALEPQAINSLSQDAFHAMARPFFLTEEEAAKLPPPTVSLGQSPDEVTAILGQPKRVVNLGAKEIYAYADMKIIFVNGKVSDVE
jgi:hypothetical protein